MLLVQPLVIFHTHIVAIGGRHTLKLQSQAVRPFICAMMGQPLLTPTTLKCTPKGVKVHPTTTLTEGIEAPNSSLSSFHASQATGFCLFGGVNFQLHALQLVLTDTSSVCEGRRKKCERHYWRCEVGRGIIKKVNSLFGDQEKEVKESQPVRKGAQDQKRIAFYLLPKGVNVSQNTHASNGGGHTYVHAYTSCCPILSVSPLLVAGPGKKYLIYI